MRRFIDLNYFFIYSNIFKITIFFFFFKLLLLLYLYIFFSYNLCNRFNFTVNFYFFKVFILQGGSLQIEGMAWTKLYLTYWRHRWKLLLELILIIISIVLNDTLSERRPSLSMHYCSPGSYVLHDSSICCAVWPTSSQFRQTSENLLEHFLLFFNLLTCSLPLMSSGNFL